MIFLLFYFAMMLYNFFSQHEHIIILFSVIYVFKQHQLHMVHYAEDYIQAENYVQSPLYI